MASLTGKTTELDVLSFLPGLIDAQESLRLDPFLFRLDSRFYFSCDNSAILPATWGVIF